MSAADEDPELAALDDAWRAIVNARPDDDPSGRSFLTLLLAAVTGNAYEGAEADAPAVAVLRAVRATVEGWARSHSGSTLYASIAFVDLHLLQCRLDVAIGILRRSPAESPEPDRQPSDRGGLTPGDGVPRKFAGKPRIKITILSRANEGMHYATLQVDPQPIYFFAHEDDVDTAEGTMLVSVVENDGAYAYVDLPARTLRTPRRMRIPLEMVLDYSPGKDGAA